MINFTIDELRRSVVQKDNWGAYLIADDFLDKHLFEDLSKDLKAFKLNPDTKVRSKLSRFGRRNEDLGSIFMMKDNPVVHEFSTLCGSSIAWKYFLSLINSSMMRKYFLDIFSHTNAYCGNVSLDDQTDSYVGCKLSMQTNNYAYKIHQDGMEKVISFLLYFQNPCWENNTTLGTDLWELTEEKQFFDKSVDSIDMQMRQGSHSDNESRYLRKEDASYVRKFHSVQFVPNRIFGFVNTDYSFHSIPPKLLPIGVTRDCFQINLWNYKRIQS